MCQDFDKVNHTLTALLGRGVMDDGSPIPDSILKLADQARQVNAGLVTAAGNTLGCSATLLPVRTVGVQGDGRSYRCILNAASSNEFHVAMWWR